MDWSPDNFDDLNYATSSERLGLMHQAHLRRKPGPLWSLARFVLGVLRAVRVRRTPEGVKTVPILAPVGTVNQSRVIEAIGPLEFLATVAVTENAPPCDLRLPLHRAYWLSLKYLSATSKAAKAARGYQALGWKYQGQEYALTPGYYEVSKRFIKDRGTRLVLLPNDHVMRHRAFERAAAAVGCRTAYVQHASVTERFPPLRTTYALLDGLDALEKYVSAGTSATTVYLTGSPLHDQLLTVGSQRLPAAGIGLCLNLLDEPSVVKEVVGRFAAVGMDQKLIVRTHPRDRRLWSHFLPGVEVRSAVAEPLTSFLQDVQVVLAGNSNVHLEAAIFGRPSLLVELSKSVEDHYGFVAAGLVEKIEVEDVVEAVNDLWEVSPKVDRRHSLRRFSAVMGTPWEGRSGALISQLLGSLADGAVSSPHFPFSFGIGEMTIYTVSEMADFELGELRMGDARRIDV